MHLIDTHPFGCAVTGFLLVNALAAGMPPPVPGSGIAYRWMHGSLNALALNVEALVRARYSRLPQLPPAGGTDNAGSPGQGNTPS